MLKEILQPSQWLTVIRYLLLQEQRWTEEDVWELIPDESRRPLLPMRKFLKALQLARQEQKSEALALLEE